MLELETGFVGCKHVTSRGFPCTPYAWGPELGTFRDSSAAADDEVIMAVIGLGGKGPFALFMMQSFEV